MDVMDDYSQDSASLSPAIVRLLHLLQACNSSHQAAIQECTETLERAIGLVPVPEAPGAEIAVDSVPLPANYPTHQSLMAALKESNQRFTKVFHSGIAICITSSSEGRFVDANASFQRLTGYDRTDVIGRTATELNLLPPGQSLQQMRDTLSQHGFLHDYEVEIQTKSGQICHALTSLEKIELNGEACVLSMFVSITDRKQAEAVLQKTNEELEQRVAERTAALRQANEQLRQEIAERQRVEANHALLAIAVEHAGDAIEITDAGFRIQYVNSAFEQITGYSKEEVIGKTPEEFFRSSEHEVGYYEAAEQTLKQGQVWRGQLISQRKDGSLISQDTTVSPVYNASQTILHYVALRRDITDRKQTEVALQESEAKFRAVSETTPIPIIIGRVSDGLIVYANQHLHTTFGYSPEDMLGRVSPELYYDTSDRQKLLNTVIQNGCLRNYELRLKKADGTPFWGALSAETLVFNGELTTLAAFFDITDLKHAEAQIKASLAEKEVLLKEIHHRVKNNLQIVMSLLRLQASRISDPKTLTVLKDSQNRIRVMALIHEKLYQAEDLARSDFGSYVRSLTTNLFRSYADELHRIDLYIQVSEFRLEMDTAIPCGLIINELVSNSLKHAFPANRKGEITVNFSLNSDNQYVLVINDNGIGLPEGLDFRNTNSLGLQLVCTLALQLKATIALDRDAGTRFTLVFVEPKFTEPKQKA